MSIEAGSLEALFGSKVYPIQTFVDGDDINIPAGVSVVSVPSTTISSGTGKVKARGVKKGSLVRIESVGTVQLNSVAGTSMTANDQMDLGGNLSLGALDAVILQRWEFVSSGVTYSGWRQFLLINI